MDGVMIYIPPKTELILTRRWSPKRVWEVQLQVVYISTRTKGKPYGGYPFNNPIGGVVHFWTPTVVHFLHKEGRCGNINLC